MEGRREDACFTISYIDVVIHEILDFCNGTALSQLGRLAPTDKISN